MTDVKEPNIVINGVRLTTAQAMTLRVALSSTEFDCGDDEHGKFMTAAYTKCKREIFNIMVSK